jgi:hypothetical protein
MQDITIGTPVTHPKYGAGVAVGLQYAETIEAPEGRPAIMVRWDDGRRFPVYVDRITRL